jgi:hypothetical protein
MYLFEDRESSQVDRIKSGASSGKYTASYHLELSPLPLAKSWDYRGKLRILRVVNRTAGKKPQIGNHTLMSVRN